MREKLIKMIEQLLSDEYGCNEFSYDFPLALFGASEELMNIFDDAPEICSMYDPYKKEENELYNDEELKEAMRKLYKKLLDSPDIK